jgi:hypothetical protein
MEYLRFFQNDPFYKVKQSQVILSVGQIVKIEPVYYVTNKDGERFRTNVEEPTEDEIVRGIGREFVIYDSLGNTYATETLSEDGRSLIEGIWKSAK